MELFVRVLHKLVASIYILLDLYDYFIFRINHRAQVLILGLQLVDDRSERANLTSSSSQLTVKSSVILGNLSQFIN